MNADKDQLDSLTERVLGTVFEVTNTLGAGFLEKVYQRALLTDSHLPESLCRRVLGRSARRRRVGGRVEMCGTAVQRAHRAVYRLFASLRPDRLSSRQFPEA